MSTIMKAAGLVRAFEEPIAGSAWIYARKSFAAADEKHKKSVEDQVAECLEVCEEVGLPTPGESEIFIESKNHGGDEWWEAHPDRGLKAMWSERRRPVLTEIMLGIVEGRCKALVVWNTDRIHREVGIAKAFIDLLAQYSVCLFDRNGEVPLSSPDSRAAYLNVAVSTQHYRETCAVNSPRGIRRSAKKGGLVTDANTLGFRSGGRFSKEVVHIPDEQEKVNELFDRCLEGLTPTQMGNRLMDEGYNWTPDLREKRGKKRNEHTEHIIYDWQIMRVLKNPMYIGKQKQFGQEWDCPAYLIDGIRPVVDPAKWHAVQAVLAVRSNGGNATNTRRPMTGLLKCGLCGQGLNVSSTNTSAIDSDGNIVRIPYWRVVRHKTDPSCWCTHSLPSIREDMLNEYVGQVLAPLLLAEIQDKAAAQAGDPRMVTRATVLHQLQEAERYYAEELPAFTDIMPRLLALKEQTCLKKIAELRERLRGADTVAMSPQAAAEHLENYAQRPAGQQRDALQAVLRWVALLPVDAPREPYPGRSNMTRPAKDQGRLVFLTAFGTYHTCVVELNRTQTDRRRQNTLRPATPEEILGTMADFPDPSGFLSGLDRAFRGGHYAHCPDTVCPGFNYGRPQPIAEFEVGDDWNVP